ncbi:hypothetical protein KC365_g13536 [Hortaea werneckii]|nr:hypothetical protein KC365_g13536 [Hortaea werneckii]
MKISIPIFALFGSALALSGQAVVDLDEPNRIQRDGAKVFGRSDEDWLLVVYDTEGTKGQCGGTDQSYLGSVAGQCLSKAAKCIDFSVSTTAAAAGMKCEAKFDSAKCGGTSEGSVTVDSGESRRGFKPGDQVRFIEVDCSKQ